MDSVLENEVLPDGAQQRMFVGALLGVVMVEQERPFSKLLEV